MLQRPGPSKKRCLEQNHIDRSGQRVAVQVYTAWHDNKLLKRLKAGLESLCPTQLVTWTPWFAREIGARADQRSAEAGKGRPLDNVTCLQKVRKSEDCRWNRACVSSLPAPTVLRRESAGRVTELTCVQPCPCPANVHVKALRYDYFRDAPKERSNAHARPHESGMHAHARPSERHAPQAAPQASHSNPAQHNHTTTAPECRTI